MALDIGHKQSIPTVQGLWMFQLGNVGFGNFRGKNKGQTMYIGEERCTGQRP